MQILTDPAFYTPWQSPLCLYNTRLITALWTCALEQSAYWYSDFFVLLFYKAASSYFFNISFVIPVMWHISWTVEVSLTLAEIQLIVQIPTFEHEHLQLLKTQRCWWMCLGIFICCAVLSLHKYAENLAVEQSQCKKRNTLVFCYVIAGCATDYKACSWTQGEGIFRFKKYSKYFSYLYFFFFVALLSNRNRCFFSLSHYIQRK